MKNEKEKINVNVVKIKKKTKKYVGYVMRRDKYNLL